MTTFNFASRISKIVLVSNFVIFFVIIVSYLSGGYDRDELNEIFKIFIPVKTVYVTAALKFLISKKARRLTTGRELSTQYVWSVSLILVSHLIILLALFSLTPFNIVSFSDMLIIFASIEAFYGLHVGLVISDIFGVKSGSST